MPWKECDRVSLREEFCRLAEVEGANMSLLCKRFSISRRTGYKWLSRYQQLGVAGLVDRSRRPREFRQSTAPEIEAQVLAVRDAHPAWGGRKIHARLKHGGCSSVPAPSTITAILHRHGRILAEASAAHAPLQRFERAAPNDLWQMDFKGEFKLSSGAWCYPLTMLDDHSRYSLVLAACQDRLRETVRGHLTAAFRQYGLPRAMLMDNGSPWGVTCLRGGRTQLTVWLMDLDVDVLHGRPYHPQTQGKEERFHRTLKLEVLQGRTFDTFEHVQQKGFDVWRNVYNHQRPHEALGQQVPSSRYRVSPRSYVERPEPFDYDASFQVRRVDREGRIVFGGREYFLSGAFGGRAVGIRATAVDGQWAVYYRSFLVGTLQAREGNPRRGGLAFTRYARESQAPADS